MTALIRQLLDFARPRALQKAPVNVDDVSRRACAELVATIAQQGPASTLHVPAYDAALRDRGR